MTRRMLSVLLIGAGAALFAGCASAGTGDSSRRDTNRLTTEEIESVNATTMMEVIERLRPRWLVARAPRSFGSETGVLVYQDQTLLGGVDQLRQLRPEMIGSARYLDAQTASSTLPGIGTGHVAGAIILTPRTARR